MTANRLSIRHWQDSLEPTGIAVVFDIFRCSTTIHCLQSKGASPLWIAPSLPVLAEEKELLSTLSIFSELRTEISCRERFDNSPKLALAHGTRDKSALVATTTGTPAMFAARNFKRVYVGSLVSFSALIKELMLTDDRITLIPAGFKEARHVEDEIAAQAVATALDGYADIAEFVQGCAEQARAQIIASGRPAELTEKLKATGAEDVAIAMDIDRFALVPTIQFASPILGKVL